jgi:ribosomal protein RSM22 (predicted rRNA methylase)
MIPISKLKTCLLNPEIDDTKTANCLKKISQVFTQDRHKIDELYMQKDYVSSYASYYMTTNMYKMEYFLDHLTNEQKSKIKETTIIEVGTGPGTYVFALASLLKGDLTLVGVDRQPLMIEQANKIKAELFPNHNINFVREVPVVDGPVTYIFGNSLNEIGPSLAKKLVSHNQVENIICIEPGTKASFAQVGEFRNLMIKQNYNAIFPCSSNSPCPILEKGLDDWCHQVVKVGLDMDIERLGQMAKLDRKVMPAIIQFYSKDLVVTQGARIIRLYKNLKHAFIWEVCGSGEAGNKIFRVEVPKKYFSKKEVKLLEKISTGHLIKYEIDKVIDENLLRIKNVELK